MPFLSSLINFLNPPFNKGGAVKDPYDGRDLLVQEVIAGAPAVTLPLEFEVPYDYPVKNQGRAWSCVAQATAAHKQYQEKKRLSARVVYKQCKLTDGYYGKGTYTRQGVKVLANFGAPEEYLAPEKNNQSDDAYLAFDITPAMTENARQHKSARYLSCAVYERDLEGKTMDEALHDSIKRSLFEYKQPIVLAIPWYGNYQPDALGILPKPNRLFLYGHAILCTGWTATDHLKCINSWGELWGVNGRFYLRRDAPKYDAWFSIDMPDIPLAEKPPAIARNIEKEKRVAMEFRALVYAKLGKNDPSRGWLGKNWFVVVNALVYFGYTPTDIFNQAYAVTRQKPIPFDLNKPRELGKLN